MQGPGREYVEYAALVPVETHLRLARVVLALAAVTTWPTHAAAQEAVDTKSRALPIAMIALGFTSMIVGSSLTLAGNAVQDQADSEMSDQGKGGAIMVGGVVLALTGAAVGAAGIVMLVARIRDKKSWVTVTQRSARLKLPGGFGIEPSGITF